MTAVVPAGAAAGAPAQYLSFMLGGEAYAIAILAIREIIEYSGLTDVPMMPECVRGVINLRGAVVPVIDLQARFGRTMTAPTRRTCIVIVETAQHGERQVSGVVVDAVNAVLDIAPADIERAPAFGARIRSDFIVGMAKADGKFIIVLDVDQVLAFEPDASLPLPTLALAAA